MISHTKAEGRGPSEELLTEYHQARKEAKGIIRRNLMDEHRDKVTKGIKEHGNDLEAGEVGPQSGHPDASVHPAYRGP